MTVTAAPSETTNHLPLVYQYTVEAYKMFQKFGESLPNPISAKMFLNFATEERDFRDLLDIKYADASVPRMKVTLGGDLRFQDVLEGDLSYREQCDLMISRESAFARRLQEFATSGSRTDHNLFSYIAGGKRAHIALLEREKQMLRMYPDWFRREDAEDLIVHGRG